MKCEIHGRKFEITESIRSYVESKVKKIEKYFNNPEELEAKVVIKQSGINYIVEVTIPAPKLLLRAEESHKDLYAAIDLVVDKVERQIRKNKTRINRKNIKESINSFITEFETKEEETDKSEIVKRKSIELKPMTEEEAILQMNLIDHEFFVFKNAVNNEVEVVYKRKDGNYGLISSK